MARERIATHPTGRSNRWSVRPTETLSGHRTLTASELDTWQVFSFDTNGSGRNLDLPAEEGSAGAYLFVGNTGGQDLTVRNDAGSTVITISTTESGIVWCDGTNWYGSVGKNT